MEELLEDIIKEALTLEVTDLHFKSLNDPMIYMRSKNQIYPFKLINLDKYKRLITYLKYKAKLDYNRLSYPQTGSFQMEISSVLYYFRLSYLPSNNDIHLVIRLLNHFKKITFNDLSQSQEELSCFRQLIKKENGLIVVCGPTGSGKSTTLHCFLEEINHMSQKNIVSIEDPVEITIDGIIQLQVNEYTGLTFENILMQVLRHDPDVIMIGELRNEKTAQIALKLSLTGHLVLTTLHASDGMSACKRLLSLGLTFEDLSQILISIISQRLFYREDTTLPFVIFETLLKEDIHHLLYHQPSTYESLYHKIKHANEMGWISDEEYEKYK